MSSTLFNDLCDSKLSDKLYTRADAILELFVVVEGLFADHPDGLYSDCRYFCAHKFLRLVSLTVLQPKLFSV